MENSWRVSKFAIQWDLDLRLHLSNSGKQPKLPWSKQANVKNIKKITNVWAQTSSSQEFWAQK